MLNALTQFDREKQKQYSIPIEVCDLKDLCDVSILKLIIGDVNDNPMSPGFSEIFVYNYEGLSYIHYSITFKRLLFFLSKHNIVQENSDLYAHFFYNFFVQIIELWF